MNPTCANECAAGVAPPAPPPPPSSCLRYGYVCDRVSTTGCVASCWIAAVGRPKTSRRLFRIIPTLPAHILYLSMYTHTHMCLSMCVCVPTTCGIYKCCHNGVQSATTSALPSSPTQRIPFIPYIPFVLVVVLIAVVVVVVVLYIDELFGIT